jgi:hypothetical protein
MKLHTLESDIRDLLDTVKELAPTFLEQRGWKFKDHHWTRGDAKISDTMTAVLVALRSSP